MQIQNCPYVLQNKLTNSTLKGGSFVLQKHCRYVFKEYKGFANNWPRLYIGGTTRPEDYGYCPDNLLATIFPSPMLPKYNYPLYTHCDIRTISR